MGRRLANAIAVINNVPWVEVLFDAGILLIVGFFVWMVVASAHAASFDGPWTASITTRRGGCGSMQSDIFVRDGVIYRGSQAGGHVAPNGRVSLNGWNSAGQGTGTGRLSASSGSGTWQASNGSESCFGVWQAWRR
jgi:hypothetical protein